MNILLTNDDGFDFPGVISLQKKLSKLGQAFIVAPDKDISGSSQAITLFENIAVKKINQFTYSVSGFPADCVNLAMSSKLIPDKIDLVISGINKGVNMGADVWYSGTVGAVRHAFIHGYSGLAISCGYSGPEGDYDTVADFMLEFIREGLVSMKPPVLLSINYPTHVDVKGAKWSHLGQRLYRDSYEEIETHTPYRMFGFNGSQLSHLPEEGSDFNHYQSGYVSITPLSIDATDYDRLKRYKQVLGQYRKQ